MHYFTVWTYQKYFYWDEYIFWNEVWRFVSLKHEISRSSTHNKFQVHKILPPIWHIYIFELCFHRYRSYDWAEKLTYYVYIILLLYNTSFRKIRGLFTTLQTLNTVRKRNRIFVFEYSESTFYLPIASGSGAGRWDYSLWQVGPKWNKLFAELSRPVM